MELSSMKGLSTSFVLVKVGIFAIILIGMIHFLLAFLTVLIGTDVLPQITDVTQFA